MSQTERDEWSPKWANREYHSRDKPSPFLVEWAQRIPKGRALDIACGDGRNALYLAQQGFEVDAVDIAPAALKQAEEKAKARHLQIHLIEADLDEYYIPSCSYNLITTSFLIKRTLIPILKDALKPGGFAFQEFHYLTNYKVGGTKDQQQRLRPNELLRLFLDFRVRYYWEGLEIEAGRVIAVERLVAQKPPADQEPSPA